MTLPDPQAMRLSFDTGFVYDMLPGWGDVMTMPHEERRRALADPDVRRHLEEGSRGAPWWAIWEDTTLSQTKAAENVAADSPAIRASTAATAMRSSRSSPR